MTDPVQALRCPECAAPVYRGMVKCEYCGTGLSFVELHTESKTPDWLKDPSAPPARLEEWRPRSRPKNDGLVAIVLVLLLVLLVTAQTQGWLKFSGPASYTGPFDPQNVVAPIRFSITCPNETFRAPWSNYTITVSNRTGVILEQYPGLFSTSNLVYVSGQVLNIRINQGAITGPPLEAFNVILPKLSLTPANYSGVKPIFTVGRCLD